jgi:hypothetical protein
VRARHDRQTARRRQSSLAGWRKRISYIESGTGTRSSELEAAGRSFEHAISVAANGVIEQGRRDDLTVVGRPGDWQRQVAVAENGDEAGGQPSRVSLLDLSQQGRKWKGGSDGSWPHGPLACNSRCSARRVFSLGPLHSPV